MRTGADYRDSLRDGRNVWVLGEGQVADVTTHPATSAMVEEYVRWYDRRSPWKKSIGCGYFATTVHGEAVEPELILLDLEVPVLAEVSREVDGAQPEHGFGHGGAM